MLRTFRKPLIIISPKIGLRHNAYNSTFDDLTKQFKPFIFDIISKAEKVNTLVFCTGQIFMEISKLKEKASNQLGKGILLVRIEELAPFPELAIKNELQSKFNISSDAKVIFSVNL